MQYRIIGASLAILASVAAQAETLRYSAVLVSRAEVPALEMPGAGTLSATLDRGTRRLSYRLVYSGLTGPAEGAHFHGPAGPKANAPHVIMLGMNGLGTALGSPITGSVTLTAAQMADLMGGKWYVNVHTKAHPDGEIRGQVMPAGGSAHRAR